MTNSSIFPVTLLSRVPPSLHAKVNAHWQTWLTVCEQQQLLPESEIDISLLGYIWACSDFVATTICRQPQSWLEMVRNGMLQNSLALADYQQALHALIDPVKPANDVVLMQLLRQFRQQHMLRIAWRDLSGLAATAETLTNLTDLAEACVDVTLEYLYQDQCQLLGTPMDSAGNPQRMVVLGMGKLGGYELNFSSDIDLIFAFAEEGETQGARVMDNGEFFLRLGQRLIRLLNEITADGFVFRVDMFLRPHGASGPLTMSFDAMEQYYQTQGRDWERYAMIKARVLGGDRVAGKELMAMLKPFVYRRYLDFGAFEAIRDMKALLDNDVKRKGNLDNIKLGLGGIREIEFIGQTYQLIRGGSEPDLQIRSIVAVLTLLAQKGLIPETESQDLIGSYDFLRRLENRLQMFADGQTHVLPTDALHRQSIALSMHYDEWSELFAAVNHHRQRVHGYFTGTFALPQFAGESSAAEKFVRIWRGDISSQEAIDVFTSQDISDGDALLQQLAA
ncbi:MAG TPA: bifunctional [glutamate--ammonia ligase]-adenylyl-L-tyrosine phosphorylase/[glutamate--ammonia-ligase] adenylyltransferase, partial [Gammaproteobacteria bacterium]|nr:bifunctional [glutamate--ammonia ligase]-adenylyl-L-tyrosine phosphorylase/[glutamate--ammonia-ligase] adenylyltransferase [Gammaproteobacteria bacterium]